jgi:hypothetical protein
MAIVYGVLNFTCLVVDRMTIEKIYVSVLRSLCAQIKIVAPLLTYNNTKIEILQGQARGPNRQHGTRSISQLSHC